MATYGHDAVSVLIKRGRVSERRIPGTQMPRRQLQRGWVPLLSSLSVEEQWSCGDEVITLDEERKQRARMLGGGGHKQGTFARDGDLSLV